MLYGVYHPPHQATGRGGDRRPETDARCNGCLLYTSDAANDHNFVAAAEDETVIGAAGLCVCSNPRMRHVGSVGIFVHTDWQGRGVGTALMETLLDLADNWLMLLRVELEVYADNERAIALYEKMGFQREGLRRIATVRRGRYIDEYSMARLRPGAWETEACR